MKFVFASDSFKNTLSSMRIAELLENAAREAFPDATCVSLPIADGGEGTLDAIAASRSGSRLTVAAHDGLMRPLSCDIFLSDGEAFVETAATCGLALLSNSEHDPLSTTSYGVGECIGAALNRGCGRITIGLGGSCTNDGGMGCLRALGARFLDSNGTELEGRGADLARVRTIDASSLHPRVREASFTLMSDVTNPLLGPHGATYVFGPQKGADAAVLEQLERGMRNFAEIIGKTTGLPPSRVQSGWKGGAQPGSIDFSTPGYGAAGGLGMALAAFLGADMTSGIETLLHWVKFDDLIADADLVVTGEGRLDFQSLQGKVVSGIAEHANRMGVPVAAICGSIALDEDEMRPIGLASALETSTGQTLDYALAHAEENYARAARDFFKRIT